MHDITNDLHEIRLIIVAENKARRERGERPITIEAQGLDTYVEYILHDTETGGPSVRGPKQDVRAYVRNRWESEEK